MMAFVLASLLIGVVLGQRFKVLVLVPGTGLAFVVTILAGIVRADAIWPIVLAAIEIAWSLQIGYIVGTGIRHLLLVARASRLRTGLLGASMQERHPAH